MHPASTFRWESAAEMLAFIQHRSFATLVDSSLRVAQAPLHVDTANQRLCLHLSRANPLARAMPVRVVAVVGGVDGYVSPDWYHQPDQVPTWDYESVEVIGTLTRTGDASLLEGLAKLSEAHESRLPGKRPWTLDKLSPTTLERLLRGIVGASLSIESLRGTQKLSQNKSRADREGVVAGLQGSPSALDRELAQRLRSELDPET